MSQTIVPDPDRDLGEQLREVFASVREELHHLVQWFPRPDTPHGGVLVVPDDDEEPGPTAPLPAGTNFAPEGDQTPSGAAAAGNQSAAPDGSNPEDDDDTPPPPPVTPDTPAAPARPAQEAPAAPAPEVPAEPVKTAEPAASGPRTAAKSGRRATGTADPSRPPAPQNQESKG